MNTLNITKDFSFNLKNDISIGETRKILKGFHEGFNNAFSLKTDIPIFLDTNILLNYYGMSMADKDALKLFFSEKIDKIYITQQIEKEFQRNRISTISEYFDELKKIKDNFKLDLQEGIKNKFNNTLQSKIVEKDFPEIMTAVKEIYQQLEVDLFNNDILKNTVNNRIDETLESEKDIEYLDPILDIYERFVRLPDLSEDELAYLQSSYTENAKTYSEAKEGAKWKVSFPGCGEKKEKDSYGDYVIFHEIIKFMKNNDKDAIFLTRDVTKSDWLQKTKKPFIHYIEKVYQLTGHFIYIFDATDLLKRISFENIYQIENQIGELDEFEDLDETDDLEFKFRKRFNKLVGSVYQYLQSYIDTNENIHIVEGRTIEGHDIDFIIEHELGFKEGLIIYDCTSGKGYKRSLQRRINACNKLVKDKIVNTASVVVVMRTKDFNSRFDYNKIRTLYKTKVIVGFIKEDDDFSFVPTQHVMLDEMNDIVKFIFN